jgi:hypothetical protein
MRLRLALMGLLATGAAMAEDCKNMLDRIDSFIARAKFSQQTYVKIKETRDKAHRLHVMGRSAQCIEEAKNLFRLLGIDEGASGRRGR